MTAAVINLAEHRAARTRCPAWCAIDQPHGRHMAATGAIAARMPGRFDLITVMAEQFDGVAAVDLRVQPSEGMIGALLDIDTLDEVIAALTEARRHLITSSRSSSEGGGRASTSGRGASPRCRPGRAHTPMEAS